MKQLIIKVLALRLQCLCFRDDVMDFRVLGFWISVKTFLGEFLFNNKRFFFMN